MKLFVYRVLFVASIVTILWTGVGTAQLNHGWWNRAPNPGTMRYAATHPFVK